MLKQTQVIYTWFAFNNLQRLTFLYSSKIGQGTKCHAREGITASYHHLQIGWNNIPESRDISRMTILENLLSISLSSC